jgi:hypothetical protein
MSWSGDGTNLQRNGWKHGGGYFFMSPMYVLVDLNPIFSSSRMKQMFQTLVECLPHLLSSLEADRVKDQPTNIKETMSSFTMEVIGSCVFGLDLDIQLSKESSTLFSPIWRRV